MWDHKIEHGVLATVKDSECTMTKKYFEIKGVMNLECLTALDCVLWWNSKLVTDKQHKYLLIPCSTNKHCQDILDLDLTLTLLWMMCLVNGTLTISYYTFTKSINLKICLTYSVLQGQMFNQALLIQNKTQIYPPHQCKCVVLSWRETIHLLTLIFLFTFLEHGRCFFGVVKEELLNTACM